MNESASFSPPFFKGFRDWNVLKRARMNDCSFWMPDSLYPQTMVDDCVSVLFERLMSCPPLGVKIEDLFCFGTNLTFSHPLSSKNFYKVFWRGYEGLFVLVERASECTLKCRWTIVGLFILNWFRNVRHLGWDERVNVSIETFLLLSHPLSSRHFNNGMFWRENDQVNALIECLRGCTL